MKRIKNFYYRFKDTFDSSFKWISLMVLCTAPYYLYQGGDYWVYGKENYSLMLISLAGISKGFMDTINHHYDGSIFYSINPKWFKFSNPFYSHTNKYIDNDFKKGRKKFLKCIPIPVMFTDLWRLSQSLHINFIMLAMVCQY
jgi:hypothetical protein